MVQVVRLDYENMGTCVGVYYNEVCSGVCLGLLGSKKYTCVIEKNIPDAILFFNIHGLGEIQFIFQKSFKINRISFIP